MDGNGRWAQKRGLPRTEGHGAGEEALFDTVEGALELGVKWLTVYAFSTENWKRPVDEVRYLMRFNEGILIRRRDELHERGVRIRFMGRRDWRVPRRLVRRMDEALELTAKNRTMTLTIAFNYGGRAEIVDAVKSLLASGVPAEKLTRRASATTCTRRTCPIPTWWCARRASTGSPTSCCGSWPTASWSSPTCCGPTSAGSTSSRRCGSSSRRDRRFGGIE